MKEEASKNILFKSLDWFIPDEMLTDFDWHELLKARLMVCTGMLGILITGFYLFTNPNYPTLFRYLFIGVMCVAFFAIFGFKFFRCSLKTIGYVSSSALWLALVGFSFLHQNYFNGTYSWLLNAVILAHFFVGTIWAASILILSIGTMFTTHYMFLDNGLTLAPHWDLDTWSTNLLTDQISAIVFAFTLIYFYNLSRQKAVDESIQAQNDLLIQQEKLFKNSRMAELGEVAGGIAHEINNPLTTINTHAKIILRLAAEDSLDSINTLKSSEKIIETCTRITKIIKGLTTYSRDAENDPMEPVNLEKLVTDVTDLYWERFHQKEIKFEVSPTLDKFVVMGRIVQLHQVLVNLLNNAVDAIQDEKEKWIHITVERNASEVILSVLDSGPGIDEALIEKVLQPFFTTKAIGKGTGLGLSIVNSILKEHEGRLIIGKRNNKSSISLVFPVDSIAA